MALESSAPEAPSLAAAASTHAALPSNSEAPTTAASITTATSGRRVANAPQRPNTAPVPGFRFHPSDEELVCYYLKRKICGKSFLFDVITDVDINKFEPWELQAKGQVKTPDKEWYFFTQLDRKYWCGVQMNRSTNEGYWKATGPDRVVKHNNLIVGWKKTLIFYRARAPVGKRTGWVMHEYRLAEEELKKYGVQKHLYVLCRIFHKTKMGPTVGNRCAPFIEEAWNDEDVVLPGNMAEEEEAAPETSKTEQELPSEAAAVPHTELPTETANMLDVYNNETCDLAPALDDGDNTPSLLRRKRRKTEFNLKASDCSGNLTQTPHQGPGSSSATTTTTHEINRSSHVSDIEEENTLMESLQQKENSPVPRSPVGASVPDSSLPPEYMGFIARLQEEVYKVSMDKETLRHELFSVRAMNNILCSLIKKLAKENEELEQKIQDD